MAKSPGGKSVGRVSIRAVPDSSRFREDLKKSLERIERSMQVSIKAVVDDGTLRESVRDAGRKAQQWAKETRASVPVSVDTLDKVWAQRLKSQVEAAAKTIEAKIPATVDGERLRSELQNRLRIISESMHATIGATMTEEEMANFRHKVHQMVDSVEKDALHIQVEAETLSASTRLRYLARDRIVTFFANVNEPSFVKVATALAALSGGRVAFNWIKDIVDGVANLDKALPKLSVLLTGLTSLASVLFSSVSGLTGIGAGLYSILPALLVIPGLFAGLVATVTVLVVALKDAKTELAELAPAMSELSSIIRTNFWAQARQPIVDLVTNLMPQLRASFDRTATAVGSFVGSLARSFDTSFSGGRLEAIFAGLADSLDILASGSDGFAGAITSLGMVGARYMPRLAKWFVDLANRFDKWLAKVANDGRLDKWMDKAVKAIYDVWDALTATGRIFAGIWKAAENAGSKGLAGFADSLERIADVVNGPRFQRTMTAIFNGAEAATESLGGALESVGDLLYDRRTDVEAFITIAGRAFSQLVSDIAGALNSPEIGKGLRDLIGGIEDGLASFGDSLPDIALGVASLWSFAGELARQIGPVLGAAVSGLSDVLSPILDYLTTEVLPVLGPALTDALNDLKQPLSDLSSSLLPLLGALSEFAVDILPGFVEGIKGLAGYISGIAFPIYELFGTIMENLDAFVSDDALNKIQDAGIAGEFGEFFQQIFTFTRDFDAGWVGFWNDFGANWTNFWHGLFVNLVSVVADGVAMILGWAQGLLQVGTLISGVASLAIAAWGQMWANLQSTVSNGVIGVIAAVMSLGSRIQGALSGAGGWLVQAGRDLINGLVSGIQQKVGAAISAVVSAGQQIINGAKGVFGIQSPSKVFRDEVGAQIVAGLVLGINRNAPSAVRAIEGLVTVPTGPTLSPSFASSGLQTAATAQGFTDQQIVLEGVGVVGWLRRLANGEARIVLAEFDSSESQTFGAGYRVGV
ncbi:MAG: hypothetical protein EPO52_05700 [Herbiconiux sp.]|uniref:phage tail protein n=1 Tax=Herbiconiux sp. TaxID=1871186 RepID=UPI0011FE61A6|nr:hypothetical protein [Herbiconiux sp.]TAJ48864.1 MAG: hypothetical protein EPO52_05700 [Herbiconiux sp.]